MSFLENFAIAQSSSDVALGHFTRTEIVVGPSIISIRDNRLDQYQRRVVDFGFAVGLGKGYMLSKHFQLVGRIFYEKKGGKYLDAEQVGNVIYKDAVTVNEIYNCITVPLTFSYSFYKGRGNPKN